MQTPRDEKKFSPVTFAPQVVRGLIRNQATRRKAMGVVLVLTVLMVIVGSTVLREPLNPREHVGLFLLFWLACAWLTLTVVLLAVFDLLMVRTQARAARRAHAAAVAAGTTDQSRS
jgi:protein-S-isoprenylcysteine O-methyltransferase Ste14